MPLWQTVLVSRCHIVDITISLPLVSKTAAPVSVLRQPMQSRHLDKSSSAKKGGEVCDGWMDRSAGLPNTVTRLTILFIRWKCANGLGESNISTPNSDDCWMMKNSMRIALNVKHKLMANGKAFVLSAKTYQGFKNVKKMLNCEVVWPHPVKYMTKFPLDIRKRNTRHENRNFFVCGDCDGENALTCWLAAMSKSCWR